MRFLHQPIASRALVCLGLLLLPLQAFGQKAIEIAVLDNAAIAPVALAVLRQAYGRLGVSLKTQVLPLRRGIQMADRGELDGDLIHSLPALKEWEHLVVVKVPVARAVFSAYSVGSTCPASLQPAELTQARIAYMRGTGAVEAVLPKEALLATANNLDALRHLQRGLSDYAVVGQLEGDALIARHRMQGLCKVPTPIASADLFHALNERHQGLALRLEAVLQQMSDSGEIKRIWSREIQRARAGAAGRPAASQRPGS